jgi:hypothetical protein
MKREYKKYLKKWKHRIEPMSFEKWADWVFPETISIVWSWEDIKHLHPKWSEMKCRKMLRLIEKHMIDRSIEYGWIIMEYALEEVEERNE